MKYCVSARQKHEILAQADEIFVEYRDMNIIYDFIENPEITADIILQIPYLYDEPVDWDEIKILSEKTYLVAAIENIQAHAEICRANKIPFYWNYPVSTFQEIRGLERLGVCFIKLGAPLYFNIEDIDKFVNIPMRMIANVCHDNLLPYENGINGTYIRPEDILVYDNFNITLEFVADTIDKEATLFKIYNEGKWPGNLNLLLTNFNYNVDNRGIDPKFGEMRLNCQQKCMKTGQCHYCNTAIKFVTVIDKKRNQNK